MSCVIDKYDEVLLNILKEKGQIVTFLDVIFGFLHRRTDFYIIQENAHGNVGFPPGVSEHTVRNVFRKWQAISKNLTHQSNISSMEEDMNVVIHEEEVVTTDSFPEEVVETTEISSAEKCKREDDLTSNTYNGANCGNYRWSQTSGEVDIEVPVPSHVVKSSDVRVDIQACRLSVTTKDSNYQWVTMVEGELSNRHLKGESIWTLLPARHITIHLQKAVETWWDSLLTSESKLDLTKLDVTRHISDFPEEDHMQIEKVIVQGERKRMGAMAPEHQEKLETLKEAWNLKGSPFRGTPFDPSVLQLPP